MPNIFLLMWILIYNLYLELLFPIPSIYMYKYTYVVNIFLGFGVCFCLFWLVFFAQYTYQFYKLQDQPDQDVAGSVAAWPAS